MYKVTYMSLTGETKQVQSGGDSPSHAKAMAIEIYKDLAIVLFVTNIYSGKVVE